jgi:hypothetical protein
MQITYEFLFERIREDPIEHLGGYSPELIHPYFMGYRNARRFHRAKPVIGRFGLLEYLDWFTENVYGGQAGFAAFCHLLTDSDENALELFFEFREIRLKELELAPAAEVAEKADLNDDSAVEHISITSLTLHETMRTKTALYFGNHSWLRGMWAMWSGYIWAERDMGIESSQDAKNFYNFQTWIDQRYQFAIARNWGKVMDFLGMGVNANAREQFYDHFELFLEGAPPDAQTKPMKEWIAACLADVKERQARGEL